MLFRDILMAAAGQSGSGTVTPDADATAWFDAVVTAGGTVSGPRRAIVNTFIVNEKAAGSWDLTDDYWVFWAESAIQALVSLKQLRTATAVASPAFTADRDYTFNGSSNYINTGFVPTTHCVAGSGSDIRVAVYERTNLNSTALAMGATEATAANTIHFVPRTSTTISTRLTSSTTATFTLSPVDSRGLLSSSRTGGATQLAYQRGVKLTNATGIVAGNTLPALAIYLGCRNSNGTAANFRADSIGFACIGAALSDAQELAQYNNVQQWATSVGAQV